MKKRNIMNKPVHLGLSVLEINKKIMYEFLYDELKPKYTEKKERHVAWI